MTSKTLGRFELTTTGGDLAYVKLPDYPVDASEHKPRLVARSIDVSDLVSGYRGPDVRLDLMADGTLIGIEIMY